MKVFQKKKILILTKLWARARVRIFYIVFKIMNTEEKKRFEIVFEWFRG
jgi:type IV secretory pathway VirB3-like protein